jgi:hypothetical protein
MTELLEYIRDRIEMSEGPQKCFRDGVFTHSLRSTYPHWWQSRGYNRASVLGAINKALSGKPVQMTIDGRGKSETQDETLGRIIDSAWPEFQHYQELNSIPMEVF